MGLSAGGLLVGAGWVAFRGHEGRAAERRLFRAARAGVRRLVGPLATSELIPFGVHRHVPEIHAAGYALIRDLYLADAPALSRLEREIIAMGVSVGNECYYCAHNHAALVAVDGGDLLAAVRERAPDRIADPRLRSIARYALSTKQADAAAAAGLPVEAASDALITAVGFHYVNRLMDALGPTGLMLKVTAKPPSAVLAAALRYHHGNPGGEGMATLRTAGVQMPAPIAAWDRREIERWGHGRPATVEAATTAWAWIQGAAHRYLKPEVLETIRAHVDGWNGEDAVLGSPWLDEAVSGLAHDPESQELARQGILVARESFRVDRDALDRACGHDPRRRLALVSFSALAAAMRIGSWLPSTP